MKLTAEDYQTGFFPTTSHNIPEDSTLIDQFNVPINFNKLIEFCDAAHANDLRKQQSTTGVVFTFMGDDMVYKLKT